ncbi:MAG: N-acetylmuramoyl-L-alanine amidase, partial [Oscillospiraceae bacterium]|nr:N-acetylmuramoyl-L-alanine amidase [Oscillospiraceae bacterium]
TRTITRNLPTPPPPPTPAPTVTQVTAPRYATVSADAAWVFPRNTLSGGSDWKLVRGQRDRITAESTNGFFRLSGGMWIRRDDVTHATAEGFTNDVLGAGQYRIGGLYDVIAWSSSVFPAIYAELDGRYLRVSFGMHTSPPPIEFPADLSGAMIESATSGIDGGIPYHLLRIRDDVSLEGYYVEFEDGEVRLRLRRRRPVTPGDMPLEGFTFVLDAGHGGDDLGAIGPMGRSMPESYIVLINTFKLAERLEELGATIYLTRDSDATVSLSDRVALSRQVKPDLFLSLHINSVEHTTNARNIRGFTVWYRNQSSAPFSRIALDMMYYINPGTNRHRGINQANFYVCRPTWAPHVLLESSFIVNIEDFAWLIDPIKQAEMADATVDTILEYFSQ